MSIDGPFEKQRILQAVKRWQRGEEREQSFRVVVESFYRPLHRFFERRGSDEQEAHDLTQETFVRIYNHMEGFRHDSGLQTWIFAVAANVFLQSNRARQAQKRGAGQPTVDLDQCQEPVSPDDPLTRAIEAQELDRLRRAMADLPSKMRQVLKLSIYQDRSRFEIAEALGISTETVKAHLHQARNAWPGPWRRKTKGTTPGAPMSKHSIPDPDSAELDLALKALFAQEQPQAEPELQELLDLVAGRLTEDEADLLMERVADSPEAMDLLLDLRRGASLHQDREEPLPEQAVTDGIDSVMSQVGAGPVPRQHSSAQQRPPHRSGAQSPSPWRWAVAALLIFAASTVLFDQVRESSRLRERLAATELDLQQQEIRVEELEAHIADARLPQPGTRVVDLFTPGGLRGDTPKGPMVPARQPAILLLTPRDPVPEQTYAVAVVGPDAGEAWQGRVTADAAGLVTLSLPEGYLTPGLWHVQLSGEQEDEQTFPFSVVQEPEVGP